MLRGIGQLFIFIFKVVWWGLKILFSIILGIIGFIALIEMAFMAENEMMQKMQREKEGGE